METNYFIYLHTCPDGKIYIGKTKKSPEVRWGENGRGYLNQKFVNAILFFGWPKIEHTILAQNLTKEEADIMETVLIKRRHSDNPEYGYNCNSGEGMKFIYEMIGLYSSGKNIKTKDIDIINVDNGKNVFEKNEELSQDLVLRRKETKNSLFVEYVKNNHIEGGKNGCNIRKLCDKWGLNWPSFTHYMYKSSDPGLNRFDQEFYDLYNNKTIYGEISLF